MQGNLQSFEGGGETVVYNGTNVWDLKLNDAGVATGKIGEMNISLTEGVSGVFTTTQLPTPLFYDPTNAAAFASGPSELQAVLQNFAGGGATVTYMGRNGSIDDYAIAFPQGVWITKIADTPLVTPTPTGTFSQFTANYFAPSVQTIVPSNPPFTPPSIFNGIEDDYTVTFGGNASGTVVSIPFWITCPAPLPRSRRPRSRSRRAISPSPW